MNRLFTLFLGAAALVAVSASGADIKARISLKSPGNAAVSYALTERGGKLVADKALPVGITQTVTADGDDEVVSITLKADSRVYVNFQAEAATGFKSADCEFYLPGFWYHRNMRSP